MCYIYSYSQLRGQICLDEYFWLSDNNKGLSLKKRPASKEAIPLINRILNQEYVLSKYAQTLRKTFEDIRNLQSISDLFDGLF